MTFLETGNEESATFVGPFVDDDVLMTAAESRVPILLMGGRWAHGEKIAKLVHARSPRAKGDFVVTRCGLYPGYLLETRFLGNVASHSRSHIRRSLRTLGHLQSANNGTLFIEQIQQATPAMQECLLQLLKTKTFTHPVSGETLHSDIRVIATSMVDLRIAAARQRFDKELADRLNVVSVEMSRLNLDSFFETPISRPTQPSAAWQLDEKVALAG